MAQWKLNTVVILLSFMVTQSKQWMQEESLFAEIEVFLYCEFQVGSIVYNLKFIAVLQ